MGCATPTTKLLFQWNLRRNPTYTKDYHSTVWFSGSGNSCRGTREGWESLPCTWPLLPSVSHHYSQPLSKTWYISGNLGLFKTQFRNHWPIWLNLNFLVKNSKLSINYHLHSQKPNQIKVNFFMWAFHTLSSIFPAICIFFQPFIKYLLSFQTEGYRDKIWPSRNENVVDERVVSIQICNNINNKNNRQYFSWVRTGKRFYKH